MTETPAPESAAAPVANPRPPQLDLAALYPACFDWKQPRPLKIGIRDDDLPQPIPVKNGMKIGIRIDSALAVATLPPKARKKLEQAQAEWPRWVAALAGKLGTRAGADGEAVVVLEQPALQVFEKPATMST